jgi:hypothetical protein
VGKGGKAGTANKESVRVAEPARRQPIFSKEHQSHAGKMLVAKRGRGYMAEIGRRGYATTIARYPNFHLEGGKASWHKHNREMLDQGYFANQSPEQWNYCQHQGCHRQKLAEGSYCVQHSG